MLESVILLGGSAIIAALVMQVFDFEKKRHSHHYKQLSPMVGKLRTEDMGSGEYMSIKYGGNPVYQTAVLVERDKSGKRIPYDLETGRGRDFHVAVSELIVGARNAAINDKPINNYLWEHRQLVDKVVNTAHEQIKTGQLTRMAPRKPRPKA